MAKWDPGRKKLEKGAPIPKKTSPFFIKKQCFFWVDFSAILYSILGKPFYNFGGQSVWNEGPLEALFQTFYWKAVKAKLMVLCTPNTTFQGFSGSGLAMLGLFFQVVFQTGSRDVILWFFLRFRLQPRTQMVTFGHHFRYKLKVDFLMKFRGVRWTDYLLKWLPGGTLWATWLKLSSRKS